MNQSREIQLGAQGRLVIPASLRKSMGLNPGDKLVARQVGDSIVLERREAVERRLKGRFADLPSDVSLADELIAERRREAQQELDGS
jgi:AbrB family looped-hinge helix DNA binding protein